MTPDEQKNLLSALHTWRELCLAREANGSVLTQIFADDNGINVFIAKEENPERLKLRFASRGRLGKSQAMLLPKQVARMDRMLACMGLPPTSGSPGTAGWRGGWDISSSFSVEAMEDIIDLKLNPELTGKWLVT